VFVCDQRPSLSNHRKADGVKRWIYKFLVQHTHTRVQLVIGTSGFQVNILICWTCKWLNCLLATRWKCKSLIYKKTRELDRNPKRLSRNFGGWEPFGDLGWELFRVSEAASTYSSVHRRGATVPVHVISFTIIAFRERLKSPICELNPLNVL